MATNKKGVIYLDDTRQMKDAIKKLKAKRQKMKKLKPQVESMARTIQTLYIEPLIADLRKYPPSKDRSRSTNWKSDRQRRYMWWLWKNKRINLPYERTGYLALGWKGETKTASRGVGIAVAVENPSPATPYVMGNTGIGTAAASIRSYERPIQPFHQETGWKPAHQKIKPAVKEAEKFFQDGITDWLDEALDFSDIK